MNPLGYQIQLDIPHQPQIELEKQFLHDRVEAHLLIQSLKKELEHERKLLQKTMELVEKIKMVSCIVCYEPYGGQTVPQSGICGHSICQLCISHLRRRNCPSCGKENSFAVPIRNFLAREILEAADIELNNDVTTLAVYAQNFNVTVVNEINSDE